ncbi:MAG: phosphate ABC transporter substrate-binding protein PstS [Planctomycetota bacterium]|nr:phosphate ABC transporter substrate-binding protein PstS [Planctomycetota bacterium]
MLRFFKFAAMFCSLGSVVASADVRLQGAGSTFVNPMMQRWVSEYQKQHPDVKVDYQSIGSGGGIKGFLDKTVDFGASDAPLNKQEISKAGGADQLIEFPVIAGGDVPAYNLPDVKEELKFSGPLLADIFLGKVTKWNDPKIVELNPGVNLPDTSITPAWRTDGSGTTFIFTSYLCTQSEEFRSNIGAGKQVKFPIGTGGKGNDGVAAAVQQTTGGIGYIEQAYADENHITYGSVQNKAGKFVKCSPDAVSKASIKAADSMKGDLLVANLWNQDGEEAYPIAGFTYVFIYKNLNNIKTTEQAQALVDYLAWASHQGQQFAADMHYAGLSEKIQAMITQACGGLTFSGTPIHANEPK